jgi:hypothetical protein
MNESSQPFPQVTAVQLVGATVSPPKPDIPANVAYAVVYTDGTFLTSALMNQAQTYLVNWLQLQNQLLYTPGVLNGLAVSNPSGNNLAVSGGAGFDELGNFVVLPDKSGAVTVPTSAANPCYVGIFYPTTVQSVSGQPNVQNMAGVLAVADTIEGLPQYSLLLAEIAITNGGVSGVTDRRTPVTSRLPANLDAATAAPVAAMRASTSRTLQGRVMVPSSALRGQGDSVAVTVPYNAQPTPGPAFSQPPHVLVTVRDALPYATAVSDVGVNDFRLTLTAVLAPQPDGAPIAVEWIAYV